MATIFASIAHLAVQESDFPPDCTPPGQGEVMESGSDKPKPCCMSTIPSLQPSRITTGSGEREYECEPDSCVSSGKGEKMYIFKGVEAECCDASAEKRVLMTCVGSSLARFPNGTQIEQPYNKACQCLGMSVLAKED